MYWTWKVVVEDQLSSAYHLSSGAPPASVLSSMLISLYIRPAEVIIHGLEYFQCAEDTHVSTCLDHLMAVVAILHHVVVKW